MKDREDEGRELQGRMIDDPLTVGQVVRGGEGWRAQH